MPEVKVENTTTNFKHNKIDISPILKDVEQCIKSGLDDKLQSFFYEFETYENTHNEVFNLTVVKNLVRHNQVLTRVISKSVCKKEVDCEEEFDNEYNFSKNSELLRLKQEVVYLKSELNRYRKINSEHESSSINLEIKEKKCNCVCNCNKSEDISIVNKMLLGQNVKNIILKEKQNNECYKSDVSEEEEEEDTEEEEEEEEEDTEEEEEVEVEEEGEDVVAAVEIHCCSSDSEEEEEKEQDEEEEEEEEEHETVNDVKEDTVADVEQEEEEQEEEEEEEEVKLPTFPTKSEIVSNITVDDVETETEEDEKEEEKEEEEVEEEEEELFEVEINGVIYVSNDDEDGNIYSYINEEVGDKVGQFKDKNATIFEGKNKGTYDRTKCKFDL